MFKFKSLYLFSYGLILSAIVGILLGLFYSLQSTLIEIFWQKATFGGLLDAIMLGGGGPSHYYFTTLFWAPPTKFGGH
ncbi:hypothetical protein QY886_08610 [Latilactobacillus sakei]